MTFLKVEVLVADADTTLNTTKKVIDYAICSPEIAHLFKLSLHDATSFSPHYSIRVSVLAHPRSIIGKVLKVPKILPFEEAQEAWNELNDFQKLRQWITAEDLAKRRLAHSKKRTGLAILGRPSQALLEDPKYNQEFLEKAGYVGESFAQAALASEYLILRLAKIPPEDRNRYTGRSQFPAMLPRPPMGKIWANKYDCEFCKFWNKMHTKITRLRNCSAQNICDAKMEVLDLLSEVDYRWPRNTTPEQITEYLEAFTNLNDVNNLNALVGHTAVLKRMAISNLVAESQKGWKAIVKERLAKGGGELFRYVSKESKDFLSVSLDDLPGTSLDPDRLLNTEFDQWAKFWGCPSQQQEEAATVGINLRQFRSYALGELSEPLEFTRLALDRSLEKYKKMWSRGSDNWGSPELLALPSVAKAAICEAVEQQAEHLSMPIQHMLNLNPLLGKIKGRRTICKTPMLYRALCRHINTIDAWDTSNRYLHDTAQKGYSAQLAALMRNLCAEIAIILGSDTRGFFFDYDIFRSSRYLTFAGMLC